MILPLVALLLCLLHGVVGWIGPFLTQPGREFSWDAASHLAQLHAVLAQGGGWPTGPNWDFYAGEPTGQFYPVGFHVAAGWATAFGSPADALRICGALAFALVPTAALALILRLGLRGANAALALVGTWSFLTLTRTSWLPQENVGGTLQATFETGLFPAALGLALALLHLTLLLHELERPRRIPLTGLLLGLLALTHVAAASFAVVASVVGYGIAFLHPGAHTRRGLLVRATVTAATAFLVAAPYALPFLVDRGEVRVLHLPVPWHPALLAVLCASCLAAGALLARGSLGRTRTRFALIFAAAVAGWLLSDLLALEFHLYRYAIFPLVLAPPLFACLEPRRAGRLALCVAFGAQLLHGERQRPRLEPPQRPPLALSTRQGAERIRAGATLVAALPHEQGGIHVLGHRIPLETGRRGLLSVIVEANPLAPFAHHVAKELEPGLPQWGLHYDPLKRYEVVHRAMLHPGRAVERRAATVLDDLGALVGLPPLQRAFLAATDPAFARARDTFARQLHRLGITSVVTTREATALFTSMGWRRASEPVVEQPAAVPAELVPRLAATHRLRATPDGVRFVFDHWIAPVGDDPPLVEIVRLPHAPDAWLPIPGAEAEVGLLPATFVPTLERLLDVASANFFDPDTTSQLVVQGDPFPVTTARDARIRDLDVSADGRRIAFRIEAPIAVPVIVKAQWSRRFRAYEDGARIPVRRVAPNFVFLHTRGPVELRYEDGWPERFGRLGFAAGLLLFVAGIAWSWRDVRRTARREVDLP